VGIFPTKLDVQLMACHRDMIVSNMKMYSTNSKIFEKYLFLAAYHNEFCDGCVGVPYYNESLKVPLLSRDINFVKGF